MWLRSGVALAVAGTVAGSCSSNSIPSLGTFICCKCSPKKTKTKTKTKKHGIFVTFLPDWIMKIISQKISAI